jgi:hypothetical protein
MNPIKTLCFITLVLSISLIPAAARKTKKAEVKEDIITTLDLPLEKLMAGKRLEMELELSQTEQPYFVFDLEKFCIELRSKGILLRTWTPKTQEIYGDPVPFGPLELLARKTKNPPRRDKIKPGEPPAPALTASGKFLLTNYEIDDMPARYSLHFKNQLELHVYSPESETGFWSGLRRRLGDLTRTAALPLRTILSRIRHTSYTRLDWIMATPQEAQSLFWVSGEKTPWLIIFPPKQD